MFDLIQPFLGDVVMLGLDDTLCRKRGLTVYGTGMHHDPLISSRAKPLTSWGHDWGVVTPIPRSPFLLCAVRSGRAAKSGACR